MKNDSNSLFSAFGPLLPFMAVVFFGILATAMTLPVIPRHVHDALGQGTTMVGVVMGVQFISAFFSRMWAGHVADAQGPRRVAVMGMLAAASTGIVYLVSLQFADRPQLALALVIAARLLTGMAESFLITGLLAWSMARLGPAHTGKVLGWVGVAIFASFGAAAPLGVALHERFGLAGLAIAAMLIPLLPLVGVMLMHVEKPGTHERPRFLSVVRDVKLPGLGLMLCSSAYAMITVFAVLLFVQRGWGGGALALTAMGAGFIVARLLFGHLPDQVGGARVTLYAALVEALGLAMIWAAPGPEVAWLGAALGGGGYALAFQALGVEAVRRAPPQSRGAAMGAYVAFQDIAMAMAGPVGGVFAQAMGLGSVFLVGAVSAAAGMWVAVRLMGNGSPGSPPSRG
ncbi:arabinose transporter [Ramlibacter sp. PS3R-8]|uniref:arabinose transporter n=1 Tax=Ramlibacter sp. PS3R-8 TaxID=3133437 RepID=UPI0030AD0C08